MQTGGRDRIGVVLANLRGLVAEVTAESMRQQQDIEIVAEVESVSDLLDRIPERADVIILGWNQLYPPPIICRQLLQKSPTLSIIVLMPDDTALIYWLTLHTQLLHFRSFASLFETIRSNRGSF